MKYIFLFVSFLWAQTLLAQSTLPIIKATSKKVSINDGGLLDKNGWSLSPKIKLDVFTADRTRKTKWVIFYTDIDSIKVKVRPGSRYNFVVLLNGKDSCFTRIASAIPPDTARKDLVTNDTIPFTLTSYNAIQVAAVINDTDTLNLHFDASSFDFNLIKEVIQKKKLDKVVKVQMGPVIWNNPEVMPTGFTSHDMDGRFGANLFENKIVEIDYDNNLLIIHSKLPTSLKGFVRSKLTFRHSFACAKGTFKIGNKKYVGDFLLDNGSDQAVILDSAWAGKLGFATNLKVIRTLVVKDPRGVKYETKIVLSPRLKINGFPVTDIPTLVLGSKNPVRFEVNYFGNDLLKRFNMILDLRNDYLYLKPNKLMGVGFKETS